MLFMVRGFHEEDYKVFVRPQVTVNKVFASYKKDDLNNLNTIYCKNFAWRQMKKNLIFD